MLMTTMSFDCVTQKRQRPEFLSVRRHALTNIARLIKMRPLKSLVIREAEAKIEEE